MDKFAILETKVRKLIDQVIELKQEKESLLAQITSLEEENRKAKKVLRENEIYSQERKIVKEKIGHILNKLTQTKL